MIPYRRARAIWLQTYLTELLQTVGGNLVEAARQAKVDRQTLYRMIQRNRLGGTLEVIRKRWAMEQLAGLRAAQDRR